MSAHRTLPIGWTFLCLGWLGSPLWATQVIANWDLVPGQRISEPFKVGVVAFHETGVSVEFAIDGEPVASIDEPAWNDRTGVWEYWFELDPAAHDDGPLAISAIASPDGSGHEARVLDPLTLFANAGGSLSNPSVVWVDRENGDDANSGTESEPKQSIMAGVAAAGDGGTVYLAASENYKLTASGGSFTYWTTVSAAPGLGPEDVRVLTNGPDDSSTGRYGKSGIRWRNLSLYCNPGPGYSNLLYIDSGQRCWFDGCWLYDRNGRWNGTTLFNDQGGSTYLTGTRISDVNNAGGDFQRNVHIERIGADIYRIAPGLTAINVSIRTMDKGETGAHPDFIQLYNPGSVSENVILYNIRCLDMLAQGFFGGAGTARDVAFVNIILEKDPPESNLRSQLGGAWEHVLFWNITEVDQTFDFRDTGAIADVDVRNCVFDIFTLDDEQHPSIGISHAHSRTLNWNQTAPLGIDATLGEVMFVDVASDDYRLQVGSPAHGSGSLPPGVPADVDGFPYNPAAPNRGAYAASNPGAAGTGAAPRLEEVGFGADGGGIASLVRLHAEPTRRFRVEGGELLGGWETLVEAFADPEGRLELRERFDVAPPQRFFRLEEIRFPEPP